MQIPHERALDGSPSQPEALSPARQHTDCKRMRRGLDIDAPHDGLQVIQRRPHGPLFSSCHTDTSATRHRTRGWVLVHRKQFHILVHQRGRQKGIGLSGEKKCTVIWQKKYRKEHAICKGLETLCINQTAPNPPMRVVQPPMCLVSTVRDATKDCPAHTQRYSEAVRSCNESTPVLPRRSRHLPGSALDGVSRKRQRPSHRSFARVSKLLDYLDDEEGPHGPLALANTLFVRCCAIFENRSHPCRVANQESFFESSCARALRGAPKTLLCQTRVSHCYGAASPPVCCRCTCQE